MHLTNTHISGNSIHNKTHSTSQLVFAQVRTIFSDIVPYFLILLGFMMPISRAISDSIIPVIGFTWLIQGNIRQKFALIFRNPLSVTVIAFVLLQLIGISYTYSLREAQRVLSKELLLLVIPLLATSPFTTTQKTKAVGAFVISMMLSVLISYLIQAKIIPSFNPDTYPNIPFLGHIHYSPFLAIAILLLIIYFKQIQEQGISAWIIIGILAFMIINLLLTKGRAGQVALVGGALLYVIISQRKSLLKMSASVIFIMASVFMAYLYVPAFHTKIDDAVQDVKWFATGQYFDTSVGKRLLFQQNTLRAIQERPLLGYGTGSFSEVYKGINEKYSPGIPVPLHPHNQFLFEWFQHGLIGLFMLIALFLVPLYTTIKEYRQSELLSKCRLVILLVYFLILFSDCYLLGHDTTILFAFLMGLFYPIRKPKSLLEEEVKAKSSAQLQIQ